MHTDWQHKHEREIVMNCQEMEELLGAYALEALDDEERKAADAHLARCPKCTHTLQQLQEIVDLFPLSVPAINPPPRVKAHILARIQEEEAMRQFPAPKALSDRRRHSVSRWPVPMLAASVLVLLLLLSASFLWNLALRQQVAQLSPHIAPPVVYQLRGSENTAAVTGQVIYDAQQHSIVLRLYHLPEPKGTQVYQGWLLQGQRPTSIGLLNIQHDVATLDFQGNLNGFDTVAVSLEQGPMASPDTPQGPIVASGVLKARS